MKIDIEAIKKLRERTGAGVADCRQCLEETGGDIKAAIKKLRDLGIKRADKKEGREVKAGAVFAYIHHNGRLGAMVALLCETDFVAKTDDFKGLGNDLAMQAAAGNPASVEELLKSPYLRDESKKVEEVIKGVIGKLGENIRVVDFRILMI